MAEIFKYNHIMLMKYEKIQFYGSLVDSNTGDILILLPKKVIKTI